jgi:hypothetical protein
MIIRAFLTLFLPTAHLLLVSANAQVAQKGPLSSICLEDGLLAENTRCDPSYD